MRISNIQNTALNVMNALRGNHSSVKSIGNNFGQNNLERNPAMDTVSFGKVIKGEGDKITKETEFTRDCMAARLVGHNNLISLYRDLEECEYLTIMPVGKVTKANDPFTAECKLVITPFNEVRSWGVNNVIVSEYNDHVQYWIDDFKKHHEYQKLDENGNEVDWMEHLSTRKDFEMAALLSRHLMEHSFFGGNNEPSGRLQWGLWIDESEY